MFDYKLIEALAMVDREGSFERAASVLYITQSAVSQRIKQLEESMGQVLIARTSPPQATAAGRRLLKHYLQVKQLENDMIDELGEPDGGGFSSLAIGINADSLALWFLEAIVPLLKEQNLALELRVADQEQTHRLLKDGEVMGCISSQNNSMKGCQIDYLGKMTYRMMATPEFAAKWFADGFTPEKISIAPAVIFDRKDDLHYKFLRRITNENLRSIPAHYVPSVEKFADFIILGFGYGMMPDQQSFPLVESGRLVELLPGFEVTVDLYWHCWSIKSTILEKLTQALTSKSNNLLHLD